MTDYRELLRVLNPEPDCARPSIDKLWARLEADALDTADSSVLTEPRPFTPNPQEALNDDWGVRTPSSARRSRASGVLLALSTAVAIAVVVGAMLAFHGHQRSPTHAASLPSSKASLVGILGVLRRPQTPADRDLGPVRLTLEHFVQPHPGSGAAVISGLRLATVTPWGAKVFLVPVRSPRQPSARATGSSESKGLGLAWLSPGAGCCSTAAGIVAGQAWMSGGSGSLNYVLVIVPDGVARVTLALAHPVTAAVHGNVAALKVPQPVENLGIHKMTWYGPSGAIVRRFPSSLPSKATSTATRASLIRQDQRSTTGIAPQILNHFPLFSSTAIGSFGHGAQMFRISQPAIASLPTFVLDTGVGSGQPTAVKTTRELTTSSGVRIWILAGKTICMFGEPGTGVGACSSDPPETLKTGMSAEPRLANGQRMLVGVLPDTNLVIKVQTTDGRIRIVPVNHGVFITSASGVTRYQVNGITGKSTWVRY